MITSSSPDSSMSVNTTLALTLSPTPRKLTIATSVMNPSAMSTMPQVPGSKPKPLARLEANAREAVDAEAATNDGDWSGSEWEDDRFTLTDEDTLEALRARLRAVGARTQAQLETADLDLAHELPAAPWFEQGARWSVRRVALHLLAEISQHAGHADIIREAIDGQHTMG